MRLATVQLVEIGPPVIPLVTALVAAGLAARVGGSAVRRLAPAKVLWALGLLLFAIAAAAEAYGAADGWGPASFRVYYLAGGCLTVGLLGAGSAWLVLPRDAALVLTGGLAVAVLGATVSVLVADLTPLGEYGAHLRPPPNDTLTGHAYLWAIGMNTAGTLLVVGSSLASIARHRRITGNALLLAGVAALAGSGTLTRFGDEGLVIAGQAVGIVLLAAGFELAERAPGTRRPHVRGLGVSAASVDRPAS
jgi:hypothetical protein